MTMPVDSEFVVILHDNILELCFENFCRKKVAWKGKESVTKILNGGGGLSSELINNSTKFFPRAKILSAYGGSILTEYSRLMHLGFMTMFNHFHEICNGPSKINVGSFHNLR